MKLFYIVYQVLLEYYDWMSNINMDFTEIKISYHNVKSNGRYGNISAAAYAIKIPRVYRQGYTQQIGPFGKTLRFVLTN